jgi:DNA-binding GntR family transcriptional regulator
MDSPLAALRSVQGITIVDQVWSQLRSLIVHGQLAPGARLIELDLARQMDTSQAAVREALQRLERDGLVERRARAGTFVTSVSADEMREIFAVRSLVEQFAIRRTIKQIRPDQLGQLTQLIERMREAGRAGDLLSLVDHDMAFHRCICEWSGHQALLRAWQPLYMQVERFVVMTHSRYFADLVDIADTHLPLLEALRGGDAEVAAARIHEHIMQR